MRSDAARSPVTTHEPRARCGSYGGYALAHPLGEGSTSIVWSGHRAVDGLELAIKTPKRRTDATTDALRAEARRLERLASVAGVVPLVDVIDDRLGVGLVLGLAGRGALDRVLVADGSLPLERTVRVLGALAQTLADLHGRGIVHADVKPANVLVQGHDTIWLGDLGSAREHLDVPPRPVLRAVGTPGYVAPEVETGSPPSPAADIYGWGVIGWCCLTGRPPNRREPVHLPAAVRSHPLLELLSSATAAAPDERPRDGRELSRMLETAVAGTSALRLRPTVPSRAVARPSPAPILPERRAWDVPTVEFGPPPPGDAPARRRRTSPVERVALAVGLTALAVGASLAVRAAAGEATRPSCATQSERPSSPPC